MMEETCDHILLHCAFTRSIWELIFVLFGVLWVLPSTVKEVLQSLQGSFVGKTRLNVSRPAPLCLFWMMWRERNKKSFDEKQISVRNKSSH